jgi:hypothetical protein
MLLSAGSTQDTPSSRHGQIGPQKEESRVRAGYYERVHTFKACSTPAAPYKPQFPDALLTCALCNNGKACFQNGPGLSYVGLLFLLQYYSNPRRELRNGCFPISKRPSEREA